VFFVTLVNTLSIEYTSEHFHTLSAALHISKRRIPPSAVQLSPQWPSEPRSKHLRTDMNFSYPKELNSNKMRFGDCNKLVVLRFS